MADNSKRTVAEKLAAAKKKHKAYLKEKAMRNNMNESKEQEMHVNNEQQNIASKEDDPIQTDETENANGNQLKVVENEEFLENESTAYEADLPLPHYSVDNNYQASSLPDPLSFFDNFNYTNVGATFQNFTQPITSLFNNTNRQEFDETIESPNQVLVETEIPNMNISNENNVQLQNPISKPFFSYENFKADALKNPSTGFEKQEDINDSEENNFIGNQVFEEFTNSIKFPQNPQNSYTNLENSENLVAPTTAKNSDTLDFVPNIFNITQDVHETRNVQENIPFMFESKPVLKTVPSDEFEDLNSKAKNTILKETDSRTLNLQNISKAMEEYIEKEDILNNSKCSSEKGSDKNNQEELYSLIDQQNAKCVELSQKLYESDMKYTKLSTEYRNLEMSKQQIESEMKSASNIEMMNDVIKLKEDLQCHLQTIGMLVAEKTELTTLLQETQSALRKESSQCIDLQNEMKEMKISYCTIENELHALKSEKTNFDSSQKQQADVFEEIRKELDEKRAQCEVITMDLLECREKLKGVTEINGYLQNQVNELNGQLSMANIKIQQLTLQESSQLESQIHKLMSEKAAYEKQISMLNESLKTVSKEREESSLQYQQYAEQLNDQISNLVQSLEQQQKENEQLKIQEEHRIKHIGDLEKQLQNVQNDNTSYNLQRNNSFLKKELESSAELAQSLQSEKEQLNMNLTRALMDKEMLEKELENCKVSLSEMESTIEQLKGSQPDNTVLLATMESDKVAASRAMAQNNELKKQMEGMQEVMLKVNNDNVQLTEIVSAERRTNKDLFEKLQKTEISFQTLADAIEIKDKELVHLRDNIETMSKQIVQQEQLSDRLRHYEAQNHSSPSLQIELQEAKHMIAHLTNELNIMKRNQLNQTTQMNQTIPINQVHQMNQTVQIDQINRMNQTNAIDQLNQINQTNSIDQVNQNTQTHHGSKEHEQGSNRDEMEELKAQLYNLKIRNEELESLSKKVHSGEHISVDTNGNETLDKETAMMHLEKKFLRTMEEIARLTEEKQRLEHLVLQLQGETETIGEYVTLYQQQRSILKQRALEKDQQLQQLTNDRETIKSNLDRLNNLVKKLIVEKGAIPKELLDQHEHFSVDKNELCSEHQKIHQEINKISNGLRDTEVVDNPNTEIAEEIISLLSEIKSSNLVQPNEEGLHCSWCSGKLITV